MKQFTLLYFLLFTAITFAQSNYTGYSTDNANGYTGSYIQPASIVNSVNKFSITSSFSSLKTNNYQGRNGSPLSLGFGNEVTKYKDHFSKGYEARNNSIDVLGVHFEINHNNAIGYSFRIRQFSNVSGLPNELTLADDQNFKTNIANTPYAFKNLSVSQFIYNEHRFNYARVLLNTGDRLLKVGAAFKFINGIDAVFLHADEGSLQFDQTTGKFIDFNGTNFEYGKAEKKNAFTSRQLGVGFDLGAVYEFRPEHDDYYYDMDGKTHIERFNDTKYKFKIGASLTDIGRVRFSKDPTSFNFKAGTTAFDITKLYELGANSIDFNSPSVFKSFDSLSAQGVKSTDQSEKFNMNLPTSLNLQFDYHFIKNIYFNYTGTFALKSNGDPSKSYNRGIHTVTARIEKYNWSIMAPISLQRNGTFNIGFAARYGFKKLPFQLFAGAHNINNAFGARARFSRNFYIGIIIAKRYSVPSDVDKDLISDEFDECKYDPGSAKLKGCPDSDGDGIPDKIDYCIYSPGPKEKNGCPDSDKDGIIDLDDQCPDQPGLAIHYGCPDRDMDGVIDVADRCPDVPGIELNNGCPFENQGCCSDNDGDGISNAVDKCPEVSGSVYNNGCPIDSTNLNKIDLNKQKETIDPNHTNQKVDEINKQHPKVEAQDGEKITKMIDREDEVESLNIYFNVDDATVSQEYDEKIRALALKYDFSPNSKYRMVLIGHTDNDGSDNYNLILSKKRAEVVRRKFEGNKVDYDLIKVYYFGENRPMKSNENDENKHFNRRVEIIIMKVG